MTLAALILVLLAAFCHASWNLLAKRAGGGPSFVWLFSFTSAVLYAPAVAIYVLCYGVHIGPTAGWFIVVSALLHLGYFLALQQGYSRGDLSLVYPLARGVGPLLAVLLAVVLLGERPGGLGLAGAVLIVLGVFVLSGGTDGARQSRHRSGAAVAFGLLTACFICGYTLVDKHAVSALGVAPLVFDWCANAGRALLITPFAATRRVDVRAQWQRHWWAILGVAVLSPLAYILVLTAMTFTPVSYIAPAREISILVATVMGARLLGEQVGTRRWIAAAGMCIGVIMLALA